MIKYVNQQTFEELLLTERSGDDPNIQEAQTVLDAIKGAAPDAALFYKIAHNEETYANTLYLVYAGIIRDGILFIFSRQTHPKTTYYICSDDAAFRHIDERSRSNARQGLTEPQRIGTPPIRKVNEWGEYLIRIYRNLERINAENEQKIEAYLARLRQLPDVEWNQWHTGGSVCRGGVLYTFQIQTTYVQEDIALSRGLRSLDDFLLISDNKYTVKL